MYVQPTAPRDIGGVIDDAIKLYRASFRTCWPIALIASVVSVATVLYLLSRFPAIVTLRDPAQMLQLFQPSIWGFYLVLIVASMVLLGAIIACQNALAMGAAPMSVGQALGAAFARVHWQLLAILLGLLYLGSVGVIVLLPLSAPVKFLGIVAWVVYSLYLWGRLQLWIVALFAEDVGTLRALRVSWDLIRGHWWRAAMILTVGIIIVAVIVAVFGFIGGLLFVVLPLDPTSVIIGSQLIGAAERVFVTSMIPALLVATYYDFKLRREGGDLAARTKALQTA
jgi:hypothetical protein